MMASWRAAGRGRWASRHQPPVLRSSVLRFIAAHADTVMSSATTEWAAMKKAHPELADAVTHTLAFGEPPHSISNTVPGSAASHGGDADSVQHPDTAGDSESAAQRGPVCGAPE
jgi:hypothetical protein